jgi:hypothetical protein
MLPIMNKNFFMKSIDSIGLIIAIKSYLNLSKTVVQLYWISVSLNFMSVEVKKLLVAKNKYINIINVLTILPFFDLHIVPLCI